MELPKKQNFSYKIIVILFIIFYFHNNTQSSYLQKESPFNNSFIWKQSSYDTWTFNDKCTEIQSVGCKYYASMKCYPDRYVSFKVTGWDKAIFHIGVEGTETAKFIIRKDGKEFKQVSISGKNLTEVIIPLSETNVLRFDTLESSSAIALFCEPKIIAY